eukprot:SAG22_NODE_11991_length_460_cov_2.529086_2_plen_67_part_00
MTVAKSWVQQKIQDEITRHKSTVEAYERMGDHTYRQPVNTTDGIHTTDMKPFLEALSKLSKQMDNT